MALKHVLGLRHTAPLTCLAICCMVGLCRSGQAASAADLDTLAPQLEQRASALRGLERRHAIRWTSVNRQQLQTYIRNLFMQQYAPGELQREGDAYKAMGLLAPRIDYERLILMLLEEQTGGYYDALQNTFYLADWSDLQQQTEIIVHELTHALQDQHFRLDDFVHRIRGNSDAMLARAALIEGEATWVGLAYTSGVTYLAPFAPTFDAQAATGEMPAPSFLDAVLMFPYAQGLAFVNYGRRPGGWQRLNQAYAHPPVSTEQILHPERYFDNRDDPETLHLPDLDGLTDSGWQPIYSDVLGEFVLRHLIATQGDPAKAVRAAAGWDGDTFQAFRRRDELAWIQLSAWDTPHDAQEYTAAMARVLSQQQPEFLLRTDAAPTRSVWQHPQQDRVMSIHRQGKQVFIVRNLEAAIAQRLRRQVWSPSP